MCTYKGGVSSLCYYVIYFSRWSLSISLEEFGELVIGFFVEGFFMYY